MAIVYRIHPAIGVARLGNHETAFFVGPEGPGSAGVEIDVGGGERPLDGYKKDGRVKRQAARFRVFAYDQDSSGDLRSSARSARTHTSSGVSTWSTGRPRTRACSARRGRGTPTSPTEAAW